ncbi:MAG TPA: hypothetical protein VF756_25820 [Thermoanaerobaculia bacterium]
MTASCDNSRISAVFGFNLASDFPFAGRLVPGDGPPDLTLTITLGPMVVSDWKGLVPVYRSPAQIPDGRNTVCLYRWGDHEVFHFSRIASFSFTERSITCQPYGPFSEAAEVRFLGPVLAYWLERQGLPALHGSAVEAGGRSVAFLSSQGGGKSGLAAAMMKLAGCKLLTDDILAVEESEGAFLARPGYPQMRMWPDEAEHFLGCFEDLPRVHRNYSKRWVEVGPGGLGSFQDAPAPLASIYLAARRRTEDTYDRIEVRRVHPAEAVIELVRHSFAPHLVEAAGLQPGRFDTLARLAQRVPVYRLSYPSGFDELPRVVEAVLRSPGISSRG